MDDHEYENPCVPTVYAIDRSLYPNLLGEKRFGEIGKHVHQLYNRGIKSSDMPVALAVPA